VKARTAGASAAHSFDQVSARTSRNELLHGTIGPMGGASIHDEIALRVLVVIARSGRR
jgi:hypothetical protein